MRTPSATLVVDAAILISATYGRSFGAVVEASRRAALATTDRAIEEARRRMALGLNRPDLLYILDALTSKITVFDAAALSPWIVRAEVALRDAVASRNGSIRDAHILALAWEADADVWTTDRDFAGAGIATWSTPNLMRALAEAA